MSAVFYPNHAIERMVIQPFDRVLRDEFENGATSARRLWTTKEFKHRLEIEHTPMTRAEWWRLRSFLKARGTFDSFFVRDNIDRTGNYEVRFRNTFPRSNEVAVIRAAVELEEIAPRVPLVEVDEVETAAGNPLFAWYDANREYFLLDENELQVTEGTVHDAALNGQDLTWQSGALDLRDYTAQYQHMAFDDNQYATRSGLTFPSADPAVTLFFVARAPTISAQSVGFCIGATGAGDCLGLQVSSSNVWSPFDDDATSWGSAVQSNSTADTWRSFAITAAGGSNDVKFYANAALKGTSTRSRDSHNGTIALGSHVDGSLFGETIDIQHAMIFKAELTLAQIKAVHNLIRHQTGMAEVV